MALFAGMAVFVFARGLVPGLGEMLIAAPAASAVRNENALAGRGEVGEGFIRFAVVYHRADGNLQNHVGAGVAGAIRTFAVTAPVSLEFTIVAIAEKRVVVGIGLEIDAPAIAAVAATGAAARNIFFAAKCDTAVAAVAGFYENLCFVNKHKISFFRSALGIQQVCAPDNKKRPLPGQRPRRRESGPLQNAAPTRTSVHSGDDADEAAATALVFELHMTGDERKQRVILTLPDILAGLVLRAALADENRARVNELASETLYAKPLTV